jgi:DNA repair protein RadC
MRLPWTKNQAFLFTHLSVIFTSMKVPLKKAQKVKIKLSGDIYPVMKEILLRENKLRRKQEYFWVISLNTLNVIENIELVALGAINTVEVGPIEIFSIPIQKRCKKVILVHNHPSGEVNPSEADIEFTKRIKAAADIMTISILDHLIITEKNYFSFIDMDLI